MLDLAFCLVTALGAAVYLRPGHRGQG